MMQWWNWIWFHPWIQFTASSSAVILTIARHERSDSLHFIPFTVMSHLTILFYHIFLPDAVKNSREETQQHWNSGNCDDHLSPHQTIIKWYRLTSFYIKWLICDLFHQSEYLCQVTWSFKKNGSRHRMVTRSGRGISFGENRWYQSGFCYG